MKRRFFLFAPLPFVPVPGLFNKEKPEREARCSCRKAGKEEPVGPETVSVLVRDNEDLLIENTTAETAIFSVTIPANHLDGNHGVRVTINAARISSHPTAPDRSATFRIKLGGTTMATMTDTLGFSVSALENKFEFDVFAKGSANAQECFGFAGGFAVAPSARYSYGSAAEDGTTDLLLQLTVQLGYAGADLGMLHRRSIVELL